MDIVPQNVHWLIPEEPVPCDIFLHFRGQFAVGLPTGQPVSFSFLEKLVKANYFYVYVRRGDLPAWDAWRAKRLVPEGEAAKDAGGSPAIKYGNKRAELLSYVLKSVNKRQTGVAELDHAFAEGAQLMKKVISHPMLDWYFQQFHEPPDLFQHNGRVAYSLTVFCLLHATCPQKDLDSLVFSAIIHELSGDPRESLKTVVSEQTIAQLEKGKHPVPQEVISYIRFHDELCSGKGFPNNKRRADIPLPVRAFTLFNQFDHYRLSATGTRRARFDASKQKMAARVSDYDPDLWAHFWEFWEKQAEAVS